MKLSKVKSIKMNKIIAQPFGKYAVVTNIFYDLYLGIFRRRIGWMNLKFFPSFTQIPGHKSFPYKQATMCQNQNGIGRSQQF